MKLLLDNNLSPRLCRTLRDLWPEMIQVRDVGLEAVDPVVWDYARQRGFTIVSKDFNNLSFLIGAPPKVTWVQLGNCSTGEVETVLRLRHGNVVAFVGDPEATLLVLGRPSNVSGGTAGQSPARRLP